MSPEKLSPAALEALKVWYAIFTTILDMPESPEADMDKLKKLRARINIEAPELNAMAGEALRRSHN